MKVILKEDDEAYDLLKADIKQMVKSALQEVLTEMSDNKDSEGEDQLWCGSEKAREILGIRKTKMQELRDHSPENGIKISRYGRTIRYYVPSLHQYLLNGIVR